MSDVADPSQYPVPHSGLPPMETDQPAISFFEFWPTKLFYIPVALHWIYLSIRHGSVTLPTAANPDFPLGGLVGESKSKVLGLAEGKAKERIANFTFVDNKPSTEETLRDALANMSRERVNFPIVTKPDMGCRGAGVKVARSDKDLESYLAKFPIDNRIVLQELIAYEPEAGVFYVRPPGTKQGRIISLTLKYFPHIIGDGTSTIKQLILSDDRASKVPHLYLGRNEKNLSKVLKKGEPYRLAFAGSHSRGAIFRDGKNFITDEMARAFDDIANGLPGFCFGRFDVRFPDIKELQSGGEFRVLEVNGAGGEVTHIWDSKTSLGEAYKSLREQFRLVFEIGAANRRLGHRPATVLELFRAYRREGNLMQDYPQTD